MMMMMMRRRRRRRRRGVHLYSYVNPTKVLTGGKIGSLFLTEYLQPIDINVF
jgi:hypothetical protein